MYTIFVVLHSGVLAGRNCTARITGVTLWYHQVKTYRLSGTARINKMYENIWGMPVFVVFWRILGNPRRYGRIRSIPRKDKDIENRYIYHVSGVEPLSQ